ncbi:coiled-coil domain-containing protein [Actinoplanes sp. NPDC049599]|uniref:coiled-coil domain-containing protein n=1 Tax=Actinoplanes sp. NPDC049599 TaxID=3363903 RepID=UPI0037A30437
MAATLLRRLQPVLAILIALAVLLVAAPAAHADPDSEGGTKSLRTALESAAKGHIEAKNKLENSKKRQKQLTATLAEAKQKAASLETRVGEVASRSYRQGRFNTMTLLLNSSSPDAFMERALRLDQMAQVDGKVLTGYQEAVVTTEQAKKAIDLEIKEQQKQVTVMAKKKQQAEQALAIAGGGAARSGFINANSPLAKPAPRNSDGSWPKESCSVNDPSPGGGGCITPRTLHAYQQARASGFKRYTGCFSQRSSGEHPKGRACDFSAASGGFENVNASGGDRTYGDNLAAYFVKNADRLGVLYVIWYRQIWQPGLGWKSYSGSGGPSATHTNHVHLSVI